MLEPFKKGLKVGAVHRDRQNEMYWRSA